MNVYKLRFDDDLLYIPVLAKKKNTFFFTYSCSSKMSWCNEVFFYSK